MTAEDLAGQIVTAQAWTTWNPIDHLAAERNTLRRKLTPRQASVRHIVILDEVCGMPVSVGVNEGVPAAAR